MAAKYNTFRASNSDSPEKNNQGHHKQVQLRQVLQGI